MWDGLHVRVNVSKTYIDRTKNKMKPARFASNEEGPTTSELDSHGIDGKFSKILVEAKTIKSTAHILFISMKGAVLYFNDDYQMVNDVKILVLYCLARMDEAIERLRCVTVLSSRDTN